MGSNSFMRNQCFVLGSNFQITVTACAVLDVPIQVLIEYVKNEMK